MQIVLLYKLIYIFMKYEVSIYIYKYECMHLDSHMILYAYICGCTYESVKLNYVQCTSYMFDRYIHV